MLAGGSRSVQRTFALSPVEARELSARKNGPYNTVAVDVHTAWRETLSRSLRIVPRHLVGFRQRGCRRIRTRNKPHEHTGHALNRSPDRVIQRARSHAIERRVDTLVFLWIDRLIG